MDLVPLADGSGGLLPVAGGAAVNSAVTLANLDVPVGFFGALSTDAMGARLEEAEVGPAGAVLHIVPEVHRDRVLLLGRGCRA